jgi:hypothetical protein
VTVKPEPPLPELADGEKRMQAVEGDPLRTVGRLVREQFGEVEGTRLLRLSIERIPEPGANERVYFERLLDVIREEHPKFAEEHPWLWD